MISPPLKPTCARLGLWIAWLSFSLVLCIRTWAAAEEENLPDELRTNGSETLRTVIPVQKDLAQSLVGLGSSADSVVLCGTIVSPDGYIVTKASEAVHISPMKVILPDGAALPARVVRREDAMDLLLIKVDRQGLKPQIWSESLGLKAAQWLCSPTDRAKEMRLGVLSAHRRRVRNSGAVMGILMAKADGAELKGVLIEHVAIESPAEVAGLQDNDLLLSINGHPVGRQEMVKSLLSQSRPGDLIKIRYAREGKELDGEVRLASRSRVEMGAGDFANHGTSMRTDDFPEVLQHDMPLSPADMGAPVLDLEGHAVGLNIARVDRVTNFALPTEVFRAKVEKWIAEDARINPK